VAERQVNVDGTGWQAGPVVLSQDGSHSLSFRALDVAGNESTSTGQTIRIDTHPPESVFVVPPNGSETWVSGVVELLGQSLDLGSGLRSIEISYDGGRTWAPLQLQLSEWGDRWDSKLVPNGTYVVLARASDVAGHLESTASVTLYVDNLSPFVDIPDSWLVGELASLVVEEQGIGLAGAQVLIADGERTLLTLQYAPDLIPSTISWDGVMPDGRGARWHTAHRSRSGGSGSATRPASKCTTDNNIPQPLAVADDWLDRIDGWPNDFQTARSTARCPGSPATGACSGSSVAGGMRRKRHA
jgi:hypothetical protein